MNVNFYCCSGVPGPPIARLLVNFFFVFFFQSDRPTQYQEMPLTLNGKKGGMALKKLELIEGVRGVKLKTSHKAIPRKILLFVQSHLRLLPYYRKLTRR